MWSLGQLNQFAKKVFGKSKLDGRSKNLTVDCPNCSDGKNNLTIETSVFIYNCWKCGLRGKNVFWLLKKYYPDFCNEFQETFLDSKILDYEYVGIKNKTFGLPFGFELLIELINSDEKEIQQAVSYLKNRGLIEKDFWYFKFGITRQDEDFKNRIIIPSFDEYGNLNYFTSRKFIKTKGIKYLNCDIEKTTIVFNELNIDWKKELTLVEGPFDLMKANSNATCVLGSLLNKNDKLFIEIIKNQTPILLAFDDDAQEKQYKVAHLLDKYGINIRIFKLPSGVHDVGEMNKKDFIRLSKEAKSFDKDDYLKYRIESIE